MDYQRKLVQDLMAPLIPNAQRKYTDRDVCKNFLVDFCPYDLFTNTKADLGTCPLVHDEKLREKYQESEEKGKLGFEFEFYDKLQRLVNDVERQIRRGNERLNVRGPDALDHSKDEFAEKVVLMERRIAALVEEIERAGSSGRIEEAQALMAEQEKLSADLDLMKRDENQNPELMGEQKRMNVCDVCAAFLIIGDCQQRIDAHMEGKQHTGYLRIRTKCDVLRKEIEAGMYKKEAPKREDRPLPPPAAASSGASFGRRDYNSGGSDRRGNYGPDRRDYGSNDYGRDRDGPRRYDRNDRHGSNGSGRRRSRSRGRYDDYDRNRYSR